MRSQEQRATTSPPTPQSGGSYDRGPAIRADKWLWYARFFKSRSLAAKVCAGGQLRVSGVKTQKASHSLHVGDVLTFPQGRHIRVVRVLALGDRRGPAAEAQTLYDDLQPPESTPRMDPAATPQRKQGSGRPTKRERREIERLRGDF